MARENQLGEDGGSLQLQIQELSAALALRDEELGRVRDEAAALRQRVAELFELGPAGLLALDDDGAILQANPAASALLGRPASDLASTRLEARLLPECRQPFEDFLRRVLSSTGKDRHVLEAALHGEPEGLLAIRIDAIGPGASGHGCLLALTDLTELRRYEDEVRRFQSGIDHDVRVRTNELESSFREMEAFSFSVSQDLRAPLLTIDGFLTKLAKRAVDRMDSEDKRLLGVIRDNARHMGRLIEDLLNFSRTNRSSLKADTIDMQALFEAALGHVLTPAEHERTEVRMAALPPAHGDERLIRVAVQNLLSNAVKFSAARPKRVLEIGARETKDGPEYSITDNGIGFDPENAEKLFGVLSRSHARHEFEGTGIGLALVKRIVERHGGRVWAEGMPDLGATLRFVLPNASRQVQRRSLRIA